jgi:phosphoglucomutase
VEGTNTIDLDAEVGSAFSLTPTSSVTIIDPFEEYVAGLKQCFDFDAMKAFAKRPGFSILFDGMHGAGGPFATRVLMEELGFPQVRYQRFMYSRMVQLGCRRLNISFTLLVGPYAVRSSTGFWQVPS